MLSLRTSRTAAASVAEVKQWVWEEPEAFSMEKDKTSRCFWRSAERGRGESSKLCTGGLDTADLDQSAFGNS